MLDFLGIDEFPADGYEVSFFPYKGKFTDEYDGYQVSLKYSTKDTPRGFGLEVRRSTHGWAKSKPSRVKTPRSPVGLCKPAEEYDDDPPPIEIEEEHEEEAPILAAIHASLVILCRNKVRESLIDDELDALEMLWCKQ